MKKLAIYYWIFTDLLIPVLGIGSVIEVITGAAEQYVQLGYPVYLAQFMGLARILALIAIIIPGWPRLKEWAYAGLTFDIAGAIYSQVATGAALTNLIFPILAILFLFGSYHFYHKRLAYKN